MAHGRRHQGSMRRLRFAGPVALLFLTWMLSACNDNARMLKSALQQQARLQNSSQPGDDTAKPLSTVEIKPIERLTEDGLHDGRNDAMTTLQDPTTAMSEFPKDRRLQVDWVKTLRQGLIDPRANLGGGEDMMVMDMDIIMKNTQAMPWVRFPHLAHTQWLHCSNCHPQIFLPRENANAISMNKVLRGQYCGVCHDKVAFSLFICERCHSVPHPGSPPKWW